MIGRFAKYMKDKTIATGIVVACGGLSIGLGLIASGVIQMRIA